MSFEATDLARKDKSLFGSPYVLWGLVALVQLALISIPLVDRLQVQMTGEEVVLELVPIDPRDLLRGDYVIINLAIADLPAEIPGAASVKAGDKVYVELSNGNEGIARPVGISVQRKSSGALAIEGTVLSATGETVRIDYGIDAFFLPEGEGKAIERMDIGDVQLVVSIAADGRSLPVRLLVDGKPFKSDTAF